MKVTDCIKKDVPGMSFEVFPPKRETSFKKVLAATDKIAALKPSFISVTYGAGGDGSRYTVDVAENILKKHNIAVMPHLTCVGSTREQIDIQLHDMESRGIHNILALRGDIPDDAAPKGQWGFRYASDLIEHIRIRGDFCLGAACYPEGHPESPNLRDDIANLKRKVDAGADFLVTQIIFDNDLFFHYMYLLREAGIGVPVIPGIMPITRKKQLKRARELSGSFVPKRFITLVDHFGDDDAAMREAGIIYATDQIIDLFANGISHVHLYTMNDPQIAKSIQDNLRPMLFPAGDGL